MKLQDQVVSLELSRKLKSLNVEQESLHYWANTVGQTDQSCWRIEPKIEDAAMEYMSAFTVAELGELIPMGFPLPERFSDIRNGVMKSFRAVFTFHEAIIEIIDNSEANIRAKMLVYLLENKLIQNT
jgi:hypothetical protein